ncbi:MAG: hypothetical protein B7X55_05565 [Rhodobacterales bacterium 34-62-10]|nr:MAG: hypothetical protein B7X55_05565 [Rhodobacterales bacterium 34-62-10]
MLGVRIMWRLIIITFAFLGWSFYTLSGGADYQPREGSRQAEALKARTAAESRVAQTPANSAPANLTPANLTPANAALNNPSLAGPLTATRNLIDLTDVPAVTAALDRPAAPLSQNPDIARDQQAGYDDKRIANISLAEPAAFAQAAGMIPVSAEAGPTPQQDLRDLRRITGNSVNMRTGPGTSFGILTRVTRDTEVEVLEVFENGWLRLRVVDSSRVGWVSSRLVSSAPDRG